MKRYIFSAQAREKMSIQIRKTCGISGLSDLINVSQRTIRDWLRGKHSVPEYFFHYFVNNYKSIKIIPLRYYDEDVFRRESGQKGGIRRYLLHGPFGTKESCSRGGHISVSKQRLNSNSPFCRQKMYTPTESDVLAEFCGIVLGDGGLNRRQLCITLNKFDDTAYAAYVRDICMALFKVPVSLIERKSVLVVLISRSNLCDFLISKGVHPGNKVKRQANVPEWIKRNNSFSKFCLRGLVDTDGCLFVDKHIASGKIYYNLGLNFSNHSIPLLDFVYQTLKQNGYNPTRTKYAVYLRREAEILKYLKDIGTSNDKFNNVLESFLSKKSSGRVPERS